MKITAHYLILAAALLGGATLSAQDYDLVIANGRVIDPETMLDEVLNVGVKDGKITAITKEAIEGRQTIDAAGHVVKKLRGGESMLAAGNGVGEVLQALEVSEPTLSRWRTQYGGMKSEAANAGRTQTGGCR
jgi:hypothetical protein